MAQCIAIKDTEFLVEKLPPKISGPRYLYWSTYQQGGINTHVISLSSKQRECSVLIIWVLLYPEFKSNTSTKLYNSYFLWIHRLHSSKIINELVPTMYPNIIKSDLFHEFKGWLNILKSFKLSHMICQLISSKTFNKFMFIND